MHKLELKPLSVNEAWQGRRFKTDDYKRFESSCFYLLPKIKIPDGKLTLNINFYFSNSNSDIDNCLKMCIDILSKKYKFNDNLIYRLNVNKFIVPKGKEFFEFEII